MILYLDTSALVKLFVEETYSNCVRRAVLRARLTTTHAIAYVEACAGFARLGNARGDEAIAGALRKSLDTYWAAWDILNVTDSLLRRAADLAAGRRLRAYDSVHLAAAESVYEVFRNQVPFHLAVFDGQLRQAARRIGIPTLEC